jgi:cell division protein FtsB
MAETDASSTEPTQDSRPDNTVDLDGLSLAQSLQDFEVANARVMDLTARLTGINRDLVVRTAELEKLRLRNRVLRQQNRSLKEELKAIQGSRSFRSASAAARVVERARKRLPR